MPHGITQCYLPPGRGDIPAITPAEAGTRLSDPGVADIHKMYFDSLNINISLWCVYVVYLPSFWFKEQLVRLVLTHV